MAPAQASPLTGEGSRRHKPILSTLTEKLSAIASPLTIEVSSPLAIDDLQNYWHPSPLNKDPRLATLAEGRKAVACSHPLDPKSTQSQLNKRQPFSTTAGRGGVSE